MNLKQLGKNIRQRRLQQKLTIEKVAKAADITAAYLSILETGKNPKTKKPSKPSFEVLEKLAPVLKLELSDLMELAGYSSSRLAFTGNSQERSLSRSLERNILDISDKIDRFQSDMKKIKYLVLPHTSKIYPSGIDKFDIQSGDHLLFLSASNSNRDYRVTMDFQAAGLQQGEAGIMRIPPELSSNSVRRILQKKLNANQMDNLILVPWESGVTSYYQPHQFSQADALKTFHHDFQQVLGKEGSMIRVTTPDASAYYSWVKNPQDILAYEHIWITDLRNLCPNKPMICLCLYRMRDLEKQKKTHFTVSQMVLNLLESHNRVMFLTKEERILYNGEAVKAILSQLDFENEPASIWDTVYQVGIKHKVWDD